MKPSDNPFAPSRLEREPPFDPALISTSWETLEQRWLALGKRAVVTGRYGSGKSTLLRAWGQRFGGEQTPVRLFFNFQKHRLDASDHAALASCAGRLLLVDGINHLPLWQRLTVIRAARKASGVLMARHHRGWWPVLLRLRSDTHLAKTLIERISPELAPRFLPSLTTQLKRCGGNLRELWLRCYDELATDTIR